MNPLPALPSPPVFHRLGAARGLYALLLALAAAPGCGNTADPDGASSGAGGSVAGPSGGASATGGAVGGAGKAGAGTTSGGSSSSGGSPSSGGAVGTGGTNGGATPQGGSANGGASAGNGAAGAAAGGGAAEGGAPVTGGSGGMTVGGASGGNGGASAGSGGADPEAPAEFILGADVSWTLEDEAAGARYYDDGVEKDLLEILADHGFNYVRLRTFVDPSAPGGYAAGQTEAWCDLEHTIEMAERVRARDMGFLLDFHYSDVWADPDDQHKPAAWEGLSFEALTAALHDYTRDSLLALDAAGVLPDMVQVGNEITPGMLSPDGDSSPQPNWANLATLLKAGIAAVREVAPNALVMLHIEKCNANDTSRWWLDSALENGVEFDVLGQSCYTEYHGTPPEWEANFADLVTRYPDLRFAIAEYSHEKRAANDVMFELPARRGLGSFIWEPTRWMESIFDRDGNRYDTNELIELYDQMAADYAF